MLRASVTVFYGLIFHEEGSDAVVQATWNEMLRTFCDTVGIAWREPQWHIGASD